MPHMLQKDATGQKSKNTGKDAYHAYQYREYKENTGRLVHWLVNTSNQVIRCHATSPRATQAHPDSPLSRAKVNRTGAVKDGHTFFIDVFEEAFNDLGGEARISQLMQTMKNQGHKRIGSDFSALHVERDNGDSDGYGDDEDKINISDTSNGLIGLDRCYITDDTTDVRLLMMVRSMAEEWIELRCFLQGLWDEFFHKSGSTSDIVLATALMKLSSLIIKRTESNVFIDAGTSISYRDLWKRVRNGKPRDFKPNPGAAISVGAQETKTMGDRFKMLEGDGGEDMEEALGKNTWEDLVNFLELYQANETNKMMKEFPPLADEWETTHFQKENTIESKRQRLRWRRSYTIYILHILVYSVDKKKKGLVFKGVWSEEEKMHLLKRRVIEDFAADITFLAMQKKGTKNRDRISPSVVFQLQYYVDVFTLSKGWSVDSSGMCKFFTPPRAFKAEQSIEVGDLSEILLQLTERDAERLSFEEQSQGVVTLEQFVPEYPPVHHGVKILYDLHAHYCDNIDSFNVGKNLHRMIHLYNRLSQCERMKQKIGLCEQMIHNIPILLFASKKPVDGQSSEQAFRGILENVERRIKKRQEAIRRDITWNPLEIVPLSYKPYIERIVEKLPNNQDTDIHDLLSDSPNEKQEKAARTTSIPLRTQMEHIRQNLEKNLCTEDMEALNPATARGQWLLGRVDYGLIETRFEEVFDCIEMELKTLRNPIYVLYYETRKSSCSFEARDKMILEVIKYPRQKPDGIEGCIEVAVKHILKLGDERLSQFLITLKDGVPLTQDLTYPRKTDDVGKTRSKETAQLIESVRSVDLDL
ncbi:hypothetical protein ACMFMG_006424 [Clarireedia jacksonii]